ncbi:MAG: Rdx family protein [Deltaproteobacteria bacterium]|nr:Rdx family protein [Deltaproteobacteria bacterium]
MKLDAVLKESSGGVYEVSLGDEIIYSKKQTGQFPDEGTVVTAIRANMNNGD